MRTAAISILLLLAAMFTTGCSGEYQLTPAEIQVAAYGSSYLGSLVTTQLLVKEQKINPSDVREVVSVLRELSEPLNQLSDPNTNIYVGVYPTLEKHVIAQITNSTQQDLALSAIGLGLRLVDQILYQHPELTQDRAEWLGLLHKVVNGLAVGMLDAIDEPADSPLRNGLTRSDYEDVTNLLLTCDHGPGCGCSTRLCRSTSIPSHNQSCRLAYCDFAGSSSRLKRLSR